MGQLLHCKLESSNRDLRISLDNAKVTSKESLPKSYEMNKLRLENIEESQVFPWTERQGHLCVSSQYHSKWVWASIMLMRLVHLAFCSEDTLCCLGGILDFCKKLS